MQLKPNTFALTLLLAGMTAIGPISNDIYLPSMPEIAQKLNAPVASVQLTLSSFLIGFSFGQIIWGPLSDKFGRKPVLFWGFALFLAATIVCATAQSIEVMIAARIVQSLGASGPIILSRAIVRDLYEGTRAGKELAMMAAIMGIAPIVAPIFGSVLQGWFGWRASFVATGIIVFAIAACAVLFLPETIREKHAGPISFTSVLRSFGVIAKHRPFWAYAGILSFGYAGLFAFISASSFVLQEVYHLSVYGFGLVFGICSTAMVLSSTIGSRIVRRIGIDGVLGIGVLLLGIGGTMVLAAALLAPQAIAPLVPGVMFVFAGMGLVIPQSHTACMMPFPERAGAASSLSGLVQMTSAAVVGSIVGAMLAVSPLVLFIAIFANCLGAFVLFAATRELRKRPR